MKSVRKIRNYIKKCKISHKKIIMDKNTRRRTAGALSNYCYNVVIVLVLIVSNFHIQCGPSAQQEQELLLLDALSRKQPFSSNVNAISGSNNNYETNTIMDMLGRSMLLKNSIIARCLVGNFE